MENSDLDEIFVMFFKSISKLHFLKMFELSIEMKLEGTLYGPTFSSFLCQI